MCAKILMLFTFLAIFVCAHASPLFDQRQTGDLNVQVDLKDLRIIALMKGGKEEYVDYDYAYDYSEMTIKPQNGTTPKPLNNSTTLGDNDTVTKLDVDPTPLPIKYNSSQNLETTEVAWYHAENDSTTVKTSEPVTMVSLESSNNKNYTTASSGTKTCRKGFVVNNKGECELKLQGTGNALLKLVKLSQKLKLRRENRQNQKEDNV